jgi:hypothetical protein
VVEVVTARVPPIVTAPEVAVIEIPVLPVACKFAVVVAAVLLTIMSPVFVVVVIALATLTAPPVIVTGPATEVAPPEIVTPEVLVLFPMRKLEGGPLRLKLVVVNVAPNEVLEDSKTTAPVVLTATVGEPFNESPVTVTDPVAAVEAARAPRLIVPVQ